MTEMDSIISEIMNFYQTDGVQPGDLTVRELAEMMHRPESTIRASLVEGRVPPGYMSVKVYSGARQHEVWVLRKKS